MRPKKVQEKGDAKRGERLFRSHCAGCHAVNSLVGIYGRQIALGNSHTTGLARHATKKWTYENLDTYLSNPKAFAPETAMGIPPIKNAKDRRDLIEFMKLPN